MASHKSGQKLISNDEAPYHYYSQINEKPNRWPVYLTITSMLLCAVAIVLLAMVMIQQDGSSQDSKSLPEVCLACDTLKQHLPTDQEADLWMNQLTQEIDMGGLKCCARTSKQLEAMLNMIQRPTKSQTAPLISEMEPPRTFRFSPVSVHTGFTAPSWEGQGPRFPQKDHILLPIRRNMTDLLKEHSRGVVLQPNAIQIAYSGLYYVYSGALFQPSFDISTLKSPYTTWFHYVHRLSPNNPLHTGILLKTAYSVAGSNPKETVYTGGVFHLKAGDWIQVCISGHGVMDFNAESSFVGLYMLGSQDITGEN